MNIGELWVAESNDGHETQWLFVVAAQSTYKRKRCVLCLKVSWDSRKLIFDESHDQAFWFFEDGEAISDFPGYLAYKARGNGMRLLSHR